jgi:hypothetical protein
MIEITFSLSLLRFCEANTWSSAAFIDDSMPAWRNAAWSAIGASLETLRLVSQSPQQ